MPLLFCATIPYHFVPFWGVLSFHRATFVSCGGSNVFMSRLLFSRCVPWSVVVVRSGMAAWHCLWDSRRPERSVFMQQEVAPYTRHTQGQGAKLHEFGPKFPKTSFEAVLRPCRGRLDTHLFHKTFAAEPCEDQYAQYCPEPTCGAQCSHTCVQPAFAAISGPF